MRRARAPRPLCQRSEPSSSAVAALSGQTGRDSTSSADSARPFLLLGRRASSAPDALIASASRHSLPFSFAPRDKKRGRCRVLSSNIRGTRSQLLPDYFWRVYVTLLAFCLGVAFERRKSAKRSSKQSFFISRRGFTQESIQKASSATHLHFHIALLLTKQTLNRFPLRYTHSFNHVIYRDGPLTITSNNYLLIIITIRKFKDSLALHCRAAYSSSHFFRRLFYLARFSILFITGSWRHSTISTPHLGPESRGVMIEWLEKWELSLASASAGRVLSLMLISRLRHKQKLFVWKIAF